MTASSGVPLLVVDACVVLKWQFDDEDDVDAALALRDDYLLRGAVALGAPTLLIYELANGVWSATRRGRLGADVARQALANLLDAQIDLHPPDGLRAFELAREHGITAYDAAYVALAERLRAQLWTADRPLFEAAARSYPWVRWIGDYGA